MTLGPRLEFRQSQSLVMTPQLRQAIKLLQFNNLEAAAFVEEELERNPLLERDERVEGNPERPSAVQPETAPALGADSADMAGAGTLPDDGAGPLDLAGDADTGGYEAFGEADGVRLSTGAGSGPGGGGDEDWDFTERLAGSICLRDHLAEQMRLNLHTREHRLIGAYLIALLEPSGRLSAAPEGIAQALGAALAEVEAVRRAMMQFDPVGLFARSLAECLGAQLLALNRLDPAMATLLDNLELLGRRDFKRLMLLCGVDWEDMQEMIREIRALDPKPGAGWDIAALPSITPDVLMRVLPGGDFVLELNPDTLPRVLVNESLYARVGAQVAREDRLYLSDRLATANWLVKSLQQRAQTILKVSAEIVQRQDGFFRHGVSHLRPLILRDIAEAVSLHESTVSRVTANKYIATPRGNFELKYFFTNAIAGSDGESHSAEAVRQRIRALVGAEQGDDVLSDDAIVLALRKEGVDIARRTVAKYRDALRIPSSVQRKREKAVPA
jgi:RNA polymerase sigma-54 factor